MKGWSYLSIRKRLLAFACVIVAVCGLIWALAGYPALTEEGWLRRLERAHLLPEGDVLLRVDTNANGPDFLVAENGAYLELCALPQSDLLATYSEEMFLYKKQGDLTAVSLPSRFYGTILRGEEGTVKCAILLFDDRPEVQKVELRFEIDGYTYTSQAEREVGGVFLCYYRRAEEAFYADELWRSYQPDIRSCTAKLYDSHGALIEETEVPMGEVVY